MRPEAGAVKDEPVETNPNPNPNSNPKANPAIKRLTLALALETYSSSSPGATLP